MAASGASFLRAVTLGDVGRSDLQLLLDAARITQQSLDGFVTRLGLMASTLGDSGQPPREFCGGKLGQCGQVPLGVTLTGLKPLA